MQRRRRHEFVRSLNALARDMLASKVVRVIPDGQAAPKRAIRIWPHADLATGDLGEGGCNRNPQDAGTRAPDRDHSSGRAAKDPGGEPTWRAKATLKALAEP